MSRAREIALLSGASKAAVLGRLPVRTVPDTAPVLNFEKMPDGKVRIVDTSHVTTDDQRQALADQLAVIATKRQGDVERVLAARAKRDRKAAKRAQSNG